MFPGGPIIIGPYPRGGYPGGLIEIVPAIPTESGLRITELFDGAAKKASLREGDVILSIGKVRTQTFEELVNVLALVTSPVEVTYLAGGSGKTEKVVITPVDGKIGVSVVQVAIK